MKCIMLCSLTYVFLGVLSLSGNYGIFRAYGHPLDSTSCGSFQFRCDNKCLNQDKWCDDKKDCLDESDEKYCLLSNSSNKDPNNCPPYLFKCDYGPCIPIVGYCDGRLNCDDFSDENNCNQTDSTLSSKATHKNDSSHINSKVPAVSTRGIKTASTSGHGVHKKVSRSTPDGEFGGFRELNIEHYNRQREMAQNFLISERKEDFGWGKETPRALVALLLSSTSSSPENTDIMLMTKQLDIKLSIALARNETKQINVTDLALYINAILVTCRSPKNFYGNDLVKILRSRVNSEQHEKSHGHFVSPVVYLTLCLNNETTVNDVKKLTAISSSKKLHMQRTGIQALALLAMSCIRKLPRYANTKIHLDFIQKLLDNIKAEGLPRNVYEVSLLIQALNEARVSGSDWKREDAIHFLLKRQAKNGSFGDILATYYALPILSGRSILSVEKHCNHFNDSDITSVEVMENTMRKNIEVHYSLYQGRPVDMTHSLNIWVEQGTNFLDIMRLAQERSSNYRFKLDGQRRKPFVYAIGGIPNDAEKGMFWTLHFVHNRTRCVPEIERLTPLNDDIKTLIPQAGDEMVFWMKPI